MRYIASAYANRFSHPILAGVLTIAVGFLAAGVAFEVLTPFTVPGLGWGVPPILAGFLGIFGILAGAIALLSYGVLLVARLVSQFRDRAAPHRA